MNWEKQGVTYSTVQENEMSTMFVISQSKQHHKAGLEINEKTQLQFCDRMRKFSRKISQIVVAKSLHCIVLSAV